MGGLTGPRGPGPAGLRAAGRLAAWALLTVLGSEAAGAAPAPIRAAYFYNYMDLGHLDSLAAAGFNRGIIRIIGDSVGVGSAPSLARWVERSVALGIEPVPDWVLQSKKRLEALRTRRRYVWGRGILEPEVACPLDSAYWRSALYDRAREVLAASRSRKLAVDLEIQWGGRKHYDAGPCRCPDCLSEYTLGAWDPRAARAAWRLSGLLAYQEARLTGILTGLLGEFAARHPGVEIGVFDLDKDSFVHRALARALARSGVPTADYCERSYGVGGAPLKGARARLDALGLAAAPLVGGLWLKRFTPQEIGPALRSIAARADGHFVFTTFSLWLEPSRLTGPYTLLGAPAEYWKSIAEANRHE